MIKVVCVFKKGGDFDEAYVRRLAAGVDANLSLPHKFICLTDAPTRFSGERLIDEVMALKSAWPGWWAKMELFGIPGPLLYFDLDTVITGPIDDLASVLMDPHRAEWLFMLRDFYRGNAASGILAWAGDLRWLLKSFREHYANRGSWRNRRGVPWLMVGQQQFRGDQEWFRSFLPSHPSLSVVFVQDVMSGIYSYKVHVRERESLPSNAKIVCFHGRPRPHEVTPLPKWMQTHWMEEEGK